MNSFCVMVKVHSLLQSESSSYNTRNSDMIGKKKYQKIYSGQSVYGPNLQLVSLPPLQLAPPPSQSQLQWPSPLPPSGAGTSPGHCSASKRSSHPPSRKWCGRHTPACWHAANNSVPTHGQTQSNPRRRNCYLQNGLWTYTVKLHLPCLATH